MRSPSGVFGAADSSLLRGLIDVQRRMVDALGRGAPPRVALQPLVRAIEDLSVGVLCSILQLREGRLWGLAVDSLPASYNEAIEGIAVGDGVGSCGTAAFRGETVISADIATDPRWSGFTELALSHGLAACWSVPIRGRDEQVLGTFALYHPCPSEPTPDDLDLLEGLARITGSVLDVARFERLLREREALQRATLQGLPGLVYRAQRRPHGPRTLEWRSDGGQASALTAGHDLDELPLPVDRASTLEQIALALDAGEPYVVSYRVAAPEGLCRWVVERGEIAWTRSDGTQGIIGTVVEAPSPEERASRLSRERAMLRVLVDGNPDLVFFKDMHGVYQAANAAFGGLVNRSVERILGVTDYELFPQTLADFFRDHDRKAMRAAEPKRNDEWLDFPDGSRRLFEMQKTALRGPDGELLGVLGVGRDVTGRHALTEALRRQADTDDLTGLPNRRAVWRLAEATAQGAPVGLPVAVAMIDLDRFKQLNDTRGHAAGDVALAGFARDLRRVLAPGDHVGRVGGDEFLVVAPGTSRAALADRLEELRPLAAHLGMSFSAGVADLPGSRRDLTEAVRAADRAMYAAKDAGRDRIHLSD